MNLSNTTILVTGGTGSFGKAFVRRILEHHNPHCVRIYSRDEYKQASMQAETDDERLRMFLGDVRDKARLSRAMRDVDIVIHAAALKRVEKCEYDPSEAVATNVIGAQNVIDAALDNGVLRVVGLSTDKAAAPNTLYGAAKLCAERLMVSANVYAGPSQIRFACTRYGNVLASRGSVVELFQNADTWLSVTDPDATRFWMTQDQAVDLVLFALENMTGGEVFVPKIPSSSIGTLATAINPEARQIITGMRPGEKLHETLITREEARHTREHADGYVILPQFNSWDGEPFPGTPVPDGFEYRSDTNPRKLSVSDIRTLLSRI